MSSHTFLGRYVILIAALAMTICPTSALVTSIEQRSPDAATQSAPNSPALRLPTSLGFAVECKPATYGGDLKVQSCREALGHIPANGNALTFGLRGKPGIDVATPWRWISC